jgi:hypothetical protein
MSQFAVVRTSRHQCSIIQKAEKMCSSLTCVRIARWPLGFLVGLRVES